MLLSTCFVHSRMSGLTGLRCSASLLHGPVTASFVAVCDVLVGLVLKGSLCCVRHVSFSAKPMCDLLWSVFVNHRGCVGCLHGVVVC